LLSFFLIITYWMRHHTLFKHIHNYNRQIIIANMLLLLPIIFFPFTTSFFYQSVASENKLILVPFRFFMLNNVMAGITTYYFYWTVMKRYKEMSYQMPKEEAMQFEEKLLLLTISFLLVFIISFYSLKYSLLGVMPVAIYNFYKKFTVNKKSIPKKIAHAEQNDSATH
ncbi:MAG: TMEM175 family protein, partial [Ferruginibacter sp.]